MGVDAAASYYGLNSYRDTRDRMRAAKAPKYGELVDRVVLRLASDDPDAKFDKQIDGEVVR